MIPLNNADERAHHWIEDWNRHDLESILNHYAEDIVFYSPFVVSIMEKSPACLEGKEQLRDYFSKAFTKYPDLNFKLHHVFSGIDSVVLYYESVMNLQAAEFMKINAEGLIQEVRAHYFQS
ncbi:MAG: nuclear transport factor 2 family protein [Deltaproteobacteria bacterium]|nr:nuclear transport factor 2 family protein [Deltaproteobacteria bacterium]